MAVARAAVSCRAYFTTTVPGLFSHTLRFPCISFSLAAPVVRVYIRRASCTPCSSMASPTSSAAGVKITAPYGTWKSPITSDVVSGAEKRLGGFAVAGDGRLLWVESRPQEGGRSVLVIESEQEGDKPIDVISPDFSVRTLAQEYGGGSFAVSGSTVIFSNYKDQRLYKQVIGEGAPVPLTPDYGGAVSYADGVFDSKFDRYITVMEDRRKDTLQPTSTIAAIDIKDGKIQEPKPLIGGNDFYAFPRIDPTGTRMAWIEWCHPNMPWDRAELWVGYFSENGDLIKHICIAGNDPGSVESASEPKWSPQGELFFITDKRNGFWNIHKWVESQNEVVPMYSLDAEFTRPLWVFGISSYDFIQKDGKNCRIACSYRKGGKSYIGTLDPTSSSFSFLDNVPFTDIGNVLSDRDCLYIEGASAMQPLSIARVKLDDSSKTAKYAIVWSSSLDCMKYLPYFSTPEVVEFPTEVQGKSAYAYFYPPSNSEYMANDDEKPPLLLKSHGGPTAESRGILNLYIQYWTSRGWAFVDVNYGGSTGYGREYRERLIGSWGITDVNDCCSCAKFLVDNGKVDGNRLCIMGGSAGGYTTLAALAFKDTFKAGASLYGVADLALLKAETHKFESHYIDNLVGSEVAYVERSPINFVERFTCPVILFQGLEDKVVPPIQARTIYQALKGRNIPVALVEYEGEQHGFRKAENIKFTLEQQMVFFARLVGKFKVADDINPVKIDNFDQL